MSVSHHALKSCLFDVVHWFQQEFYPSQETCGVSFMKLSLQIGGVWSFHKAMSDRAERFPLVKCSRAETFFSLELCFPLAPTFDNAAWSLTTLNTYWIKSLIYDQLTNIASWGEIFSTNQCTVLYKSWEHKAYCLQISFILAGIKAVFSTKEFAKGDLVWNSSSHWGFLKYFLALWQL